MNPQPIERFGRYELRGWLGAGSFADVFRAYDPLLGRMVALKARYPALAGDPDNRERFLAEARTLAALSQPNLVTVFDVGDAGGRPYFTMEIVEGQTLERLLAHGKGFPFARVLQIVAALSSAVDDLHEAGIVHRDIKASSVMITPRGAINLMDLGIALTLGGARPAQDDLRLGTPDTAAPQQIAGATIGPAADIYALGVLTYQMLAGRLPFRGELAQVLEQHAHQPPPPLRVFRPDLPAPAYAAVERALEKEPERRPLTAHAFYELLSAPATRDTSLVPGGAAPFRVPHLPPMRTGETGATPVDTLAERTAQPLRRGARVPVHQMPPTAPWSLPTGARLRLFGRRAVAALIDLAIGFALYLLGDVVFGQFVSFIVWFAYLWWGNATGRSAGKRALQLRVTGADGSRPSGVKAGLGRTLAYGVSLSAFGIGFLLPLWDPAGRSIHDNLAGTYLLKDNRRASLPPSP